MGKWGTVTRRAFLVAGAALAGGVVVGYWYVDKPYPNPLEEGLADGEATFNPFVKIASDGTITVIVPRAEMGQGVSTTLAAFVAEELDVGLDRIKVEHGPTSSAYYNEGMAAEVAPFAAYDEGHRARAVRAVMGMVGGKVLGLQRTGSSSSARDGFDRMRQAGAAARAMLVQAAAERLGVPPAELSTDEGRILHRATGRSLTYGAVAVDAARVPAPKVVVLKDRKHWKLLGQAQRRVDMRDKVTGAPIFGIDVKLPDMLHGTVLMSPVLGSAPRKFDLSKASKIPGVVKILQIDTVYGHGFGVIAGDTWTAFRAAAAIEVDWWTAVHPADTAALMEVIGEAAASGDGSAMRNDGDVDAAFSGTGGNTFVEAKYSVPYLSHAPLEPMNCTARMSDGKLEIWAPNQTPTLVRWLCAKLAGVPAEDTTVHTMSMGGAFGRRLEVDYALYATALAKEAGGRPVKVTWTREEEIRHGPYRPAAVARMRARLGADGLPVAVDMRLATQHIVRSFVGRMLPDLKLGGSDKSTTDGAYNQPYRIPNYRVTGVTAPLDLPVTFWRSVGSSQNGFFHEAFMDEIAAAGRLDPIAMRRNLMAGHPTALAVLDRIAEMSRWDERLPAGKAKGFAFTLSFGSWCAQVIQVADTPDGIRLESMWIAADVGLVLDPAIVEAQLFSGAVYGLSAAMAQEITFEGGRVLQSNFHDFPSMRIGQAPRFEVALLENAHRMGGVGEVGTPPAAPALANAIFALTGKRHRSLPLGRHVKFA